MFQFFLREISGSISAHYAFLELTFFTLNLNANSYDHHTLQRCYFENKLENGYFYGKDLLKGLSIKSQSGAFQENVTTFELFSYLKTISKIEAIRLASGLQLEAFRCGSILFAPFTPKKQQYTDIPRGVHCHGSNMCHHIATIASISCYTDSIRFVKLIYDYYLFT